MSIDPDPPDETGISRSQTEESEASSGGASTTEPGTSDAEAGEANQISPYRSDQIQSLDRRDSDHFGHREYADAIISALPLFPSPFTLGLFGPWGTGKSTILGDVGKRLNGTNEPDSAMAVFDAWRYEGDSLRREFIREIGEQLGEEGALEGAFDLGEEIKQFDVAVTLPKERGWEINRGAILPAAVAALLAFAVLFGVYFGLPHLGASPETVLKFETAMIGSLAAFVLVVANRVVVPVQLQESRQRFEYPDQFASSFRRMLEAVRVKRLVIGIDNLDRCSPQRVTEILSTVKGFLEPALAANEHGLQTLCFVIAADDEALRRHLAVEEAARVAIQPGKEEESREAVEEAVDEYLRKFFNASVRIADALDEDMLGFTTREFQGFFESQELTGKPVGDRLVEMTAQALKRNPRRVKQFVNGLTLRLQIFEDRRRAKRIQIEPDVLVIAKLAILEEEFRPQFKELRENPSLLVQWQEQSALAEGDQGEMPRRMIGFLRFTDDIQVEHIRAYLTQKQTVHERELPGYGEFTEDLEEGRRPELLSEASPEEIERYQAAAKDYFDRAIRDRTWSTAHNTIRALLATPALYGPSGKVAAGILDEAISQQELKERLPQLDPRLLVSAASRSLPPYRWRIALGVLLDAAREPEGDSYRGALSQALAGVIDSLDEPSRQLILKAYGADGLRQDFASYESLATAWPELVGEQAVGEALDQLEGTNFNGSEPAFSLISTVILRSPEDTAPAVRLLASARQSLSALRTDDPDGYSQLSEGLIPLIETSGEVESAPELASEINETFDHLPEERRRTALALGLALCASSPAADSAAGDALGRRTREAVAGPELPAWISAHPDLPPIFREGMKSRLREEIAADGNPDALSALSAFPAQEAQAALTAALVQATQNGAYGIVEQLLGRLGQSQREEVGAAAASALAEVAPNADQHRPLLDFVVEHQDLIEQQALERIAAGLVQMFVDRRETADDLGGIVARIDIEDAQKRQELIRPLLDLETDVGDPDRKGAVLVAAAGLAGRHVSNAQKAVSERFDERERSDDVNVREAAKRARGAS